ncbi:RND family transporter [Psychrobium sp. 1_MG-2023]|uniref:efflux RND transporter permease subunit n=1 Tax=Psychrobium sp. 1_MG-2023 TaxID=3062624 RepID=UPI000C33925B|nr:MMPL family transporter [Psychrobium sp. 1_MG-2023]MDP2562435.1 MMPL family transporter [Psychrobium sp. 1_MG-2023]PKF56163.1 RND transporter [Alteromonadales bacterium alter-6D02]
MSPKSSWLMSYSHWLVRWRWIVVISSLIVAMAAMSGVTKIRFDNEYRVFFSDDNPQLQAFDQLQRTYTKVDNILFAIESNNNEPLSNNALAAIEELSHQAWQLPFSLRVDSLNNFQHTWSEQDDLIVEDLFQGGAQLTPEQIAKVKSNALAEPFLKGQLINNDGSMIAANVTFQMPQKSEDEAPIAVAAARKLANDIEQKYDVTIYLTGVVMLSNSFFEASMNDMSTLIPLMYAVIILITFLLVRSKSATFSTVVVIIASMMSALGVAGHLGIALTPPSSSATTIIMTLAVADSIHILVSMFSAMRQGMTRQQAIAESLRLNFSPVALTSITTAVGFMSMNFSDSPPFHDLGNITAIGVMFAWLFSVSLLPALMAIFPAKARQSNNSFDKSMVTFANFIIAKRKLMLGASVAASILLLTFIPQNKLDDNFIAYFDESVSFRTDSDYINDNLTGLFQLQYSLDSGVNNGVATTDFLHKVDSFATWLRQQPEVTHVNTLSDTFKRLNMNMHGDDPAFYRLPESNELAAQYLLLYELSLPYGLDLNNQLNISKSSTQLIITLQDMPTTKLREMAARGTQWLKENHQLDSVGIGPAIMFAHISERNINSMIVGTIVALIVISGLITLALRSVRLGLLSLVPNLLPAGLAFGIWGLTIGQVDMSIAMVTGMMLGIVVDDTVHFLSKYLRARREKGLTAPDAVRYAFSSVGVAIITTSIILVAGFMVLAQSSFGMNSGMAMLTAIGIGTALVADFLLLPALLMLLDKKQHPAVQPTAQPTTLHSTSQETQHASFS